MLRGRRARSFIARPVLPLPRHRPLTLHPPAMSSYPPSGIKETGSPDHFTPRPLVPLGTPVVQILPPLPTPQRESAIGDTYTLTTHLVPAASPRTTHHVPDPKLPTWSADRQQWKASVMETVADVLTTKEKQRHGVLKGPLSQKVLWNCLNRYVRRDSSGTRAGCGVTLLFAHANGFPKEVWVCLGLLMGRIIQRCGMADMGTCAPPSRRPPF